MPQSDRNRILFATVIAKCWEDAAYKQTFIEEPKTVCTAEGIMVPDDITLEVKEDTATLTHVVLPDKNTDEAISALRELLHNSLPLPSGHTLALVQNTDKLNYLVIPINPRSISVELTDADLEALSAGGYTATTSNIVANHQVAANAVAVANGVVASHVAVAALGVCVLVLYPFNSPAFLKVSPNVKLEIE